MTARPGPRPWQALGVYLAAVLGYLVVTVALVIWTTDGSFDLLTLPGSTLLWVALLPNFLGLAGVAALAVAVFRWPLASVHFAPSRVPMWTAAPLALAAWTAAIPLSVWGDRWRPAPDLEAFIEALVGGNPFILVVLVLAVAPALAEEALFRGVVLAGLRPWGVPVAVGVSALLFALTHANIAQGVYTVYLGVLLALVALRTRSIWVPVGVHFLANFSTVVLMTARAPEGQDPSWADGVWDWLEGLGDFDLAGLFVGGTLFAIWLLRTLPLTPSPDPEAEPAEG